ncbi:unnamed protein product [Caenorhabditis sp. 36 PRJEB53466]|nr:unnamed protein product [Caenorhabditis sp. 36 PRJEB53466]
MKAQVEGGDRDFEAERRRIKVFMSHRMRESAEYFMDKFGEAWKTEKIAIDKMSVLRKYLIDELEKIDEQEREEQEEQEEEQESDKNE